MHIHVVKRGDTLSSIAAMHDALPAFVAADAEDTAHRARGGDAFVHRAGL